MLPGQLSDFGPYKREGGLQGDRQRLRNDDAWFPSMCNRKSEAANPAA